MFCLENDFNIEFGSYSDEAHRILTETYPMVIKKKDGYYYNFNLDEIFSEAMDLFSLEPVMVPDSFIINSIFEDESIHPTIIMTLTELIQRHMDYEPITDIGEFWMTFSDIRRYYGDTFDQDMTSLFPNDYSQFKDYFME